MQNKLQESNDKLLERIMFYRKQCNSLRQELSTQKEMTTHFRTKSDILRKKYREFLNDLQQYEFDQENHPVRTDKQLSTIKAVLHWVRFYAENRFNKNTKHEKYN